VRDVDVCVAMLARAGVGVVEITLDSDARAPPRSSTRGGPAPRS